MKSESLNISSTSGGIEMVSTEFKKVTISLPTKLYDEGMNLVSKGLFSNFSDLVRSGIRNEFKELQPVVSDLDEKLIYNDKKLIAEVLESHEDIKKGKGKTFKNTTEMKKYFERL
jgi:Arc/MetJ-type ribon-helix-helix transcriptional regulator